jgi:hypothetical protein
MLVHEASCKVIGLLELAKKSDEIAGGDFA